MIYLELTFKYGAVVKRWVFDTKEEAEAELTRLTPLMGRSYYDDNEDGSDKLKKVPKTHTIVAKCGNGAVVTSEIQSAGVVIMEEWFKVKEIEDEWNRKQAAIWRDAGLK